MDRLNSEYRAKAEHCRIMADAATSDQVRSGWLDLAMRWLMMVKEESAPRDNVLHGDFEPKQASMADRLKHG